MNSRAITLRELAFVRDVLIPRAWVQGTEVDELFRLRARVDGIFAGLREEQVAQAREHPVASTSVQPASQPEQKKKPRHPKKRRGPPPPTADES